ETLPGVHPGARERERFDQERRSLDHRSVGFEVLQTKELTRLEVAGGGGSPHDDFDDRRSQPMDGGHARGETILDPLAKSLPFIRPRDRALRTVSEQNARNRAIALLRRGHGFDDVAVERRMVVSEKSDELSAARVAGEEGGLVRFVGGLELPAAFSFRPAPRGGGGKSGGERPSETSRVSPFRR